MMAPSSRLLFWTAVVTVSSALVWAASPQTGTAALAAVALFGLAVAADAFGARKSMDGIAVELPPVVRMLMGREQEVEVRIRNPRGRGRRVRVALGLPVEIPASLEERDIDLPAAAEWSRVAWKCTGLKRGAYPLSTAYVEGLSPWRLWAARKAVPLRSEIRVYPNLMKERRHLAAMFLRRGALGVHAQRQVGKGRDFEKLREYLPGDAFDEVDWKGSARRGKPVTKVFQIERTQEVYAVIDASRLSARPAPLDPGNAVESAAESTLLERLMAAALVLGIAAEQQGDLFGLIAFSDQVDRFVRSKNGKAHYSVCRDALYTLRPRAVTPDFDELCAFIRVRLRRRALIVFLTSLDDPGIAEGFVRGVDLIRRQHLTLVQSIQQPGAQPLFSDSSPTSTDDLYARLGGHLRWNRLRQLERTLKRRGVAFASIPNERLAANVVSEYLSIKQRQLI